MAVLLSLVSAAAFGISDFAGGWEARRSPAAKVTLVASTAGLAVALLGSLILGGKPTVFDVAAGAIAGIGGGIGLMLLYSALGRGPIGVAAPVSAVMASVVPFVYGLASGERPPQLAVVGSVLAVASIPLITWEPGQGESGRSGRTLVGGDRRRGWVRGLLHRHLPGCRHGRPVAIGRRPGDEPIAHGRLVDRCRNKLGQDRQHLRGPRGSG